RLGDDNAPLYYRRRRRNIARKAGNIADFCKRWGGGYDYLLVLDADSLMEPTSIIELARRMEADRDAGLIQTVPRLVHGKTVFARLHQFASRIYGPAIATGLAWWVGGEGNYWGHNAIIRRRAFTEAAGLPDLPGKAPFGGHILSHDFVEAALIRRAGWTVKIADDIQGSYEETPPSLVDFAIRDRRWCQGNLQHVGVLPARGLHWVSRFHLVSGILSYLASFLWLLLIAAGFGLAVQAYFTPPDYFSDPHQLFPTWPQIDSVLQLRLLALTDPLERNGLPAGLYRAGLPGRLWWLDGARSRDAWQEKWAARQQRLDALARRLALPLTHLDTADAVAESLPPLLRETAWAA
ncbi:MAG: glucans biosynthesis glucosyltransferase MdoH, partial [Thiobacillus sp.]|nr:glucans biosynthesis glucosyltransferase MdoH [Thiobacillus sp.]